MLYRANIIATIRPAENLFFYIFSANKKSTGARAAVQHFFTNIHEVAGVKYETTTQ